MTWIKQEPGWYTNKSLNVGIVRESDGLWYIYTRKTGDTGINPSKTLKEAKKKCSSISQP